MGGVEKRIRRCFEDFDYCRSIFEEAEKIIDDEHGVRISFPDGPAEYKLKVISPGKYIQSPLEEDGD